MDDSSFDRLVRSVAATGSRRGLLRSTVAAIGGFGTASLLTTDDAEAKSCKQKCQQKDNKDARKKCKKKCKNQNPPTPVGGKQPGTLCQSPSECAPPFTCALPLNDSGGDKRCCGATGAPCGGDNIDLDDQPPICCQGFVCSTNNIPNGGPGTCQPAP